MLEVLNSSGIPFAYHAWKKGEAPSLPFGVFVFVRSENFAADGIVYFQRNRYNVELYTRKKDTAHEEAVENVLDINGVYWEKSETYIESEKVFQILYEIEV